MAVDITDSTNGTASSVSRLKATLKETRDIDLYSVVLSGGILQDVEEVSRILKAQRISREAEALQEALIHCTTAPYCGGLGYSLDESLSEEQSSEVLFFVSAYLEALNYQDRHSSPVTALEFRPPSRRGMTVSEKILAAHDASRKGEVKTGDVIRLDVDWVIASELSWAGMESTYDKLGKPGIFRNDRLWIAGDHVVDPRVMDHPRIKPLVEASERARRVFKLTDYQGMNYTIMHTEFCRERAQPGMLIVGSDSHTCSAGSVSSLAIGLGVADVTLPLVTGETWIKVPEIVEIRFINNPKMGLGGKDVILYILKELKRNTVAAERIVEYTGPGLRYLSCDARFAICNMTTEFGGVTGICVPDDITADFINRRRNPRHKRDALYYRPDEDAKYAETYIVDLDMVEPFVARYPNPDDVVPVCTVAGTKLDGCFIGACTTAYEDLVLAALVLEVGLKRGLQPIERGKRKVVPGSLPILHDLEERGLANIYRQAGFDIGVPGCSYCVGMSADKAGKGEVWLSSQNRNFENRMGPGAIGSITSAVTVAASSFDMTITDPASFLDDIDMARLKDILGGNDVQLKATVRYVEPASQVASVMSDEFNNATPTQLQNGTRALPNPAARSRKISGKVHTLGDFIDTDALAPAEALVGNLSAEEMGRYCLYHTHPDFRRRVKEDGLNIVVAGRAFGVGSSRENAVTALQGAGVQCVIARSFAFIYARNQPNLGMLGVVMEDEEFYKLATDGESIEIDVDGRAITVGGRVFDFSIAQLEIQLWEQGGVSAAFGKWGKDMLRALTGSPVTCKEVTMERPLNSDKLAW
ncbi:aconitase iron-sulfur domain-containing protein [Coniochaeta sp. PMI_546]|nr:aconitase iron-sulfur domain-containing protein [Coniochaeta sp. PMI_546]